MGPERPRGGFKRLVDDLYYGEVSGHAPIDNAAPEAGIQFSPKVLEKYLRKLYGGDFDVSTDIEPSAWREVLRILNDAVATGISQSDAAPTLEQDFYDQLRHSNEVFSAFKVHSMGKRMAALLTDDSGQLKPFHKWRDEVMPIASHYVGPWLRTEYNTAVNRAHDAADWKQFERNSDIMPNLRWMPTTSAEPDAEHRIFWKMKLTRPIDDPFWNKHRPGDHWNCKCTLEQTDEPPTDIPAGADDEAPQPGLKGNPAKTGQIFDRSHPYFPKSCKGCAFNKRKMSIKNWFRNEAGDCYLCFSKNDISISKTEISMAKSLVDNSSPITKKISCQISSFSQDSKDKLKKLGVDLVNTSIHISDDRIHHALRYNKVNAGKSVTPDELKHFIENIDSYSMYYDSLKKNIVFATTQNGRSTKYIVSPNQKVKINGEKIITNLFTTAGVIKKHNLEESYLKKIR